MQKAKKNTKQTKSSINSQISGLFTPKNKSTVLSTKHPAWADKVIQTVPKVTKKTTARMKKIKDLTNKCSDIFLEIQNQSIEDRIKREDSIWKNTDTGEDTEDTVELTDVNDYPLKEDVLTNPSLVKMPEHKSETCAKIVALKQTLKEISVFFIENNHFAEATECLQWASQSQILIFKAEKIIRMGEHSKVLSKPSA
jgi:hypothetical protein